MTRTQLLWIGALLALSSLISRLHGQVLIPMDNESQSDHLKAYGLMFEAIERGYDCHWLLNHRGGSFAILNADETIVRSALVKGVSYESTTAQDLVTLLAQLKSPERNTNTVALEKVPKVAVYSPPGKQPWDDAVTLVLTYAEIPFTTIYDTEVLEGDLDQYDWLHLHHEDFTGQYGKILRIVP